MLSTLTVLNTADSGPGSLRAEIAAANNGDTIRFAHELAGKTITLTSGELVVGKSVDIEGPGAAKLTVSGNDASRVFDIQGGANVTIAGLTVANGLVGAVTGDAGGGIENEPGATFSLANDTVAHNTAYGIGGGLWNQIGGTVAISGSTFVGNVVRAGDGAAGAAGQSGGSGGQAAGGALSLFTPGNVDQVSDSAFANNQALGGRGGVGGTGARTRSGNP